MEAEATPIIQNRRNPSRELRRAVQGTATRRHNSSKPRDPGTLAKAPGSSATPRKHIKETEQLTQP
jgi:hypothetical protein